MFLADGILVAALSHHGVITHTLAGRSITLVRESQTRFRPLHSTSVLLPVQPCVELRRASFIFMSSQKILFLYISSL